MLKARDFSWVVLTAEWSSECSEAVDLLRQKLKTQALLSANQLPQFLTLEQAPELHHSAQMLLESQQIVPSWPMHLFVTPSQRVFFAATGADPEVVLKWARDFFAMSLLDPSRVEREADRVFEQARLWDPLGEPLQARLSVTRSEWTDSALKSLALTPIEASLDWNTGWVGRSWVWPAALGYRLLLWGDAQAELPLVRLARSSLCDVIGGGFFRGFDSARSRMATEKLLIDNVLMLETYLEASLVYPSTSFLKDVSAGIFRCLEEEFWNGTGFAAGLMGKESFYVLGSRDLLGCVPAAHRAWAQRLMGLGLEASLPSLKSSVAEISAEFLAEPVDVQNALAELRGTLKSYREKRGVKPKQVGWSWRFEAEAIRVLLKFARFESWAKPRITEQASVVLKRWESMGVPERMDAPFVLRSLIAVERYAPDLLLSPSLQSLYRVVRESVLDGDIESFWTDFEFLGQRRPMMDSVGMSPIAAVLHAKLDLGQWRPSEESVWASRAQPLGLHAAGVLGACLRSRARSAESLQQ